MNKIELDATTPRILVSCDKTGGSYSQDTGESCSIDVNAYKGMIETRNDNGVAQLSAAGLFCNNAGTDFYSSIVGGIGKSAIVGLGYGSVPVSSWALNNDINMIAGVFGRANNSNANPAPAYGGYFYDLKACGFILNTKYITDSSTYTDRTLTKAISQVIGLTNSGTTQQIYLPTDGYLGRIILVHQMGQGSLRIYPSGGQHIYDDDSENSYYDCGCGDTCLFIYGKWNINNVTKEIWIVRRFNL